MPQALSIRSGSLAGIQIGKVVHYRNIPYAEAGRFEPPRPASSWQGVRDASRHGPVCPQLQSPIAPVLGKPSEAEQDEACLSLSVAVPAELRAPCPVMLWLHGGAYVVGAGSFDWYRPDALVSEGGVIVVNVNYRLGAFGYLRMAGVSPGNLGLLDKLAALRWVQDNIAAFGGDPQQVTVFGESAGGHAIAALLACPQSRGLFRRAIAQSPHLGAGFVSQSRAQRVANALRRCLNGADPRSVSSSELLAAQRCMQVQLAGPGGLNSVPAFGPIAGVAPLPETTHTDPIRALLHTDVDLVIGSTRDEMRAYFDLNPNIAALGRVPGLGPRLYKAFVRDWTERIFARPARRLADAQAEAGRARVYLYRFEWAPPNAPFGSCHTIDLPFTFGGDSWASSPMLGQTSPEELARLGRELRSAWTHFAHTGDANAPGTPIWQQHRPGDEPARRFFVDRGG